MPTVLSPEEITRMIEAAPNLMHRTILIVLYGTGIRRTEASLLKVSDIDSERMVVHIRQGKGSRDRVCRLLISCWVRMLLTWNPGREASSRR